MNPLKLRHQDKELKALQWLAMGAMGLYLFRVMRKEGHLGNTITDHNAAKFQTRKMMELGAMVAESYVPPEARPVMEKLKNPILDLGTHFVNKMLGQDGDE